eukprot:Anaeramoba_ignava/a484289_33.p1 GENE.a484289_33~~a484289_33.p1  ORF type:complete len:304 (-),score=101.60 a484289_33:106-1017(-)
MIASFTVKLTNFVGTGLNACDRGGTSDPFLKISFDSVKRFQTEVIKKTLEPKWKFNADFTYETHSAERMISKILKIDCFDWNKIKKAESMGSFSLNLWDLATGPVSIDYLLRLRGKPAGRIQFNAEMIQQSEVSIFFEDISVSNVVGKFQNGTSDIYLEYYFSTKSDLKKKTETIRGVTEANWKDTSKLFFPATLQDILDGKLIITLYHENRESPEIIGDCEIKIKLNEITEQLQIDLDTEIYNSGKVTGNIKGKINVLNIPQFAQMIGGKNTEKGITGGSVRLQSGYTPKDYPEKGKGGPPK